MMYSSIQLVSALPLEAPTSTMGTVLKKEFGKIDFHLEDSTVDVLGNAYDYLIGKFAAEAQVKKRWRVLHFPRKCLLWCHVSLLTRTPISKPSTTPRAVPVPFS